MDSVHVLFEWRGEDGWTVVAIFSSEAKAREWAPTHCAGTILVNQYLVDPPISPAAV